MDHTLDILDVFRLKSNLNFFKKAGILKIIFECNDALFYELFQFNTIKGFGTIFFDGFQIVSDNSLLQRKLLCLY